MVGINFNISNDDTIDPSKAQALKSEKVAMWLNTKRHIEKRRYHVPLSVRKFMAFATQDERSTLDQIERACVMLLDNYETAFEKVPLGTKTVYNYT